MNLLKAISGAIFGQRMTRRELMVIGDYTNDGFLYTNEQWEAARESLRSYFHERGNDIVHIRRLRTVGSLTVFGPNQSVLGHYYMYDLMRGRIREDRVKAYEDYCERVQWAGLIPSV